MKGVNFRGAAVAAMGLWAMVQVHAEQLPPRLEDRSVVFAQGSASLSPHVQSALQALAGEIGDAPVTVIARDDDGQDVSLAEARAKIISATLRSAGISRHNITVSPPAPGAGAGKALPSQVRWIAHLPPAAAEQAATPASLPTPARAASLTPSSYTVRSDRVQSPDLMPVAPAAGVPPTKPVTTSAVASSIPSQPPAVAGQALGPWEVKASDVTLLRTIERWASAAGYKLKWDAAKNFLIGAPDVYNGSFEMALQAVLSSPGIRLSDYPLEACIYANTPPLVRITRQGEQARECSAADPQ